MMLLDTHVWLRWLSPGDDPLPRALVDKLEAAHDLAVSAVSCIALDGPIAASAASLTDIHRDPADRFIIATCLATQRRLLTLDSTMQSYPEMANHLA